LNERRYPERLLITKPVTLQAAEGAAVQVAWETDRPYESTVECSADGVALLGLAIAHRSPSIANNYAVRLLSCDARLQGCTITSATGSGVGIEGGSPSLLRCALRGCARSGVMAFGEAGGGGGAPRVQGCVIEGCGLHGVLARDGTAPEVTDNTISRNGGFGLALQGCGGRFEGNALAANRGGAVALSLFDGAADEELARLNGLDPASIQNRKV
jgi:hypothetical protein